MKIIRQRQRHEEECHRLSFDYEGERGCGFSFDCDKDGKVDEDKLKADKPLAWESYQACLKGEIVAGDPPKTYKIQPGYVDSWTHRWTEHAIGLCNHCNEEVVLSGFTNTCDRCGTDYNGSGQELAPRSQWGEETGECLSDILSVDGTDTETLLEG